MLSLLDIAERMQKGPKVDENDWNMDLFHKMNELTEEYQLVYPEDGSFFNMDDDLADRAFQAGVDFLVEKGAYCISTSRVTRFSRLRIPQVCTRSPLGPRQVQRDVAAVAYWSLPVYRSLL